MNDMTMTDEGEEIKDITMVGMIVPYNGDIPFYLELDDDVLCIPCFTTEAKMLTSLVDVLSVSTIISTKIIKDEERFLGSIGKDIKVIIDPEILPDGRVKFITPNKPKSEPSPTSN